MDRKTEISLLKDLFELKANRSFFMVDKASDAPVDRYYDESRFKAEQKHIFQKLPVIAAHICELPDAGSFLTRDIAGQPTLITRDQDNQIHVFLNVCRHRGAQIEGQHKGCKRAFSCPYHAWTYSSKGELIGVPHEKQGFPGLDRDQHSLKRLPSLLEAGLIWVLADKDSRFDMKNIIAPVKADLDWLQLKDMAFAASETLTVNANWKIIVEGGIEAYHFKITHKATIGPHFMDNLSRYDMLGPHMRSVLARNSVKSLEKLPQEEWNIREHSNILYSIFPLDQFLTMEDHVIWIHARPVEVDKTELRISTLALKSELTAEKAAHWERNHQIAVSTLKEDFAINESIQKGLKSGANGTLTFGRFESALKVFNAEVEAHLR